MLVHVVFDQALLLLLLLDFRFPHLVVEVAVVFVLILEHDFLLLIAEEGHPPVLCDLVELLLLERDGLVDLGFFPFVEGVILVSNSILDLPIHDVPLRALHLLFVYV